MKTIKLALAFLAMCLVAFTAVAKSVPLAIVECIVFACLLVPMHIALNECRLGTPTLITDILTGKIIAPLLTKVPELGYFSTDFGVQGSEFAPPVKFGQEVISHLIAAPVAEAYTPGTGLGSNSQNPKDLLTDAKVRIDQAAKVTIKLPTTDAIRYMLTAAFLETMNQGTIALGRYVLNKVATTKFNQRCFSQELVVTKEGNEFSQLNKARAAQNKLGTLTPRFILGDTDWMLELAEDPVVTSGDYFGQRTGDDPYLTLVNIAGYSQVREFPNMPSGTVEVGTVVGEADDDTLTLAAHGLTNGTRVRFTNSGGALPTGLAVDTDYYVHTATTNTFKVSTTVGGGALNLSGDGSGTTKVFKFEALNALAFERRAVHLAFRHLLDNSEMARQLGIPETSRKILVPASDTQVPVTWHLWEDTTGTNPTGDVFATGVVAFGAVAGREIVDPTNPEEQTAGKGMDYGALRLVESAAALAA